MILHDLAEQVLAHAVEALDTIDVTPSRAYVSAGDPPADCHILAVWATPTVKDPGPRQRCAIIPEAFVRARWWRCLPTGTPPTEAALATAGEEFHDSLWAVWSHLAHFITTGTLIDSLSCANASLLDAQIEPEEGGYGGWLITLRADLAPLTVAS